MASYDANHKNTEYVLYLALMKRKKYQNYIYHYNDSAKNALNRNSM